MSEDRNARDASMYRFPEAWSIRDHGMVWQAAKLAEECGEVSQAIIKGTRQKVISEVIDVMQVCENILHQCECTEGMYREAMNSHIVKCEERGVYVDDEAVL